MTNLRTCSGLICQTVSKNISDGTTHVVFLAETKEPSDLRSPLWTQTLWVNGVGQAGQVLLSLLDNAKSEDGEVHTDDAATNRLPLALAGASWSETGMAVREQQSNASGMHDTLLHRKPLLVVTAGDFENVAFELVAQTITRYLLAHSSVHENAEFTIIVNLDQFL